ncbi:spore coat protein [Paenibacillus sp. GXUN7292]|uniref:spore coat protein n=1 Tax=Paenibacillus sp. GXUN7292 TaxID=3422499 RepID=UPI003D7D6906
MYYGYAKNGVRNYAVAVTEAVTPEIGETLKQQLELNEQLQLDLNNAETALNLT